MVASVVMSVVPSYYCILKTYYWTSSHSEYAWNTCRWTWNNRQSIN